MEAEDEIIHVELWHDGRREAENRGTSLRDAFTINAVLLNPPMKVVMQSRKVL